MGCCSSKDATAKTRGLDEEYSVLNIGGGTVHGAPSTRSNAAAPSNIREPTVSEKRRRVAEAAESRQTDWRQGGASDPEKAKALRERREKDELLGKIYNRYNVLGKEPPIGLPSCDVDQLKRHLATLR